MAGDRTAAYRRGAAEAAFPLVGYSASPLESPPQYSHLSRAGHDSMAKLLNVFQVSVLHNVVQLLFGWPDCREPHPDRFARLTSWATA